MLIAPLPAFAALHRRAGFSASLSAIIDHNAAPGVIGRLRIFGASGAARLVGAPPDRAPGSGGGRFSLRQSGGEIIVSFDRDGLGDGFAEGESAVASLAVEITDGSETATARIRATVRRALTPPVFLGPIPDQMDMLP
ncbi:MAG: hypothetical protein ACK5MQ_12005 [Pikeienuella sp.]